MTERIPFTFNGKQMSAPAHMSVAAALTEAGERAFRDTDAGAKRGVFCGMGVCQDCLVEIDGRANQRACMTKLAPDMEIRRQQARPPLGAQASAAPAPLQPETLHPDVLVVGGGIGGLNAALAASRAGADTVLIDERTVAGGQYFKQSAEKDAAPLDPQQARGADLVADLAASSVRRITGAEVWGAFDGPVVVAASASHVYTLRPKTLIVATGAYERPAMIPGWTLPGVMTVGAAQTLWRSYRVAPGKRVAIFGNGPLNAQVALELAEASAAVVALGEAAPSPLARPASALAMTRADTALALSGARMLARLALKGIFTRWATVPEKIEPTPDGALRVSYVSASGKRGSVICDTLCMNFGFQPQNEILRLLGAEMTHDARFAHLRTTRSATMETSVPGVYAIGDCCGLGGAPAAAVEGAIAGAAAAGSPAPSQADRRALEGHRRFQDALWATYAAPLPDLATATPETHVCRCEEVTRETLDAALEANPTDIGAVKRATRIGMGRCQGRYCAPAVSAYLAKRTGKPLGERSLFAPRVPIKPVSIAAISATEGLDSPEAPADER